MSNVAIVHKPLNTLVISERPEISSALNRALQDIEYQVIFEGNSVQDILSVSLDDQPELIIATMESCDQIVLSKFKVINERFPLPIVVFTQDNRDEAIEQAIEAGVSAYIVDGFREDRVESILRTAVARFRQYQSMQKNIKQLQTSLADRKIIERAKGIVMAQRDCSEEQAYSLLRSSAMDQNIRLVQLAQNVIATADLLEPQIT